MFLNDRMMLAMLCALTSVVLTDASMSLFFFVLGILTVVSDLDELT
jgi:hypothetical protein